jgi:hypothetical protein
VAKAVSGLKAMKARRTEREVRAVPKMRAFLLESLPLGIGRLAVLRILPSMSASRALFNALDPPAAP